MTGTSSAEQATPFWAQYLTQKAAHPDALLWMRLGDFYEMFEDDAHTAVRVLHITLTARELGKGHRVPMAGIPFHAAESYLARLIRAGYHVAICEQLSEPGHGLVERDVVRVVTPGTLAEPGLLAQRQNRYLAAAVLQGDRAGLAYVDVTTGEFAMTALEGDDTAAELEAELRRLQPAETLTPADQEEPFDLPGYRTARDAWQFDPQVGAQELARHFAPASLAAIHEGPPSLSTGCAAAIVRYIGQTNPTLLPHITNLMGYRTGSFLRIDAASSRALNILTGPSGKPEGSLLATVDRTKSAMGARLLRRWLSQPLLDVERIRQRQERVARWKQLAELRSANRQHLSTILDIERITGRCRAGNAPARDLWALHHAIETAKHLRQPEADGSLAPVVDSAASCDDVAALIHRALAPAGDNRVIRQGFSNEFDALEASGALDRDWMAGLEETERAATGIRSLKVGFTRVFGYFIEVTNPNKAAVPAHYQRKQTVAGGERYFTAELKERETRLLRNDLDCETLAQALYQGLLSEVSQRGERLLALASTLAELDVVTSLAEIAAERSWCRPLVDGDAALQLVEARHPVVESVLPPHEFIPNDLNIGAGGPSTLVITGPNMAGKSTYLRQIALIVVLAQMGSFVPANQARVGIVDRVFTRIGAADDLAGGVSTFMLEMQEAATICRQATPSSLVVLDEIGRGTSSAEGAAIAQAVIEYLHQHIGPRMLFSTHFHQLPEALATLPRLELWTFSIIQLGEHLAFTHRITPGVAELSYGVHTARLAGLPENVLVRALALLDVPELAESGPAGPPSTSVSEPAGSSNGLSLAASQHTNRPDVLAALAAVDVATTTPLEALLLLAKWQAQLRGAPSRT